MIGLSATSESNRKYPVLRIELNHVIPESPDSSARTECQSTRMSKIKNGGLDQYGAEPFEQQQFGTADVHRHHHHQLTFSEWLK